MKQRSLYRSPDGTDPSGTTTAPKTDNTKLIFTHNQYPVYVSPHGNNNTNEPFPKSGVDYDFCAYVGNSATVASGPFLVKFSLSNDDTGDVADYTFTQDAGLDPSAEVQAVVHYDKMLPNDNTNFSLIACIYSPSAPDKPIGGCVTFGFSPNIGAASASSQGNSSTDTSGTSSGDNNGSGDSSGSADNTNSPKDNTSSSGDNPSDTSGTSNN